MKLQRYKLNEESLTKKPTSPQHNFHTTNDRREAGRRFSGGGDNGDTGTCQKGHCS